MSFSPFANDLLPLMPLLVTLAPSAGVTGNGQRSYGTARTYHAYLTADSKAIYGTTGTVVFSTSVISIHPKALDGTVLTAITPDALLTLPDGTTPRILSIGAIHDDVGIVGWQIRS